MTKKITRENNCSNCRFSFKDDNQLQCRRYPPKMVLWAIDNDKPVTMQPYKTWPDIEKTEFCGEWRPENEFSFMKEKVKR